MTPQEIQKRVDAIRSKSRDSGEAHWMEDKLHQDVLLAIAENRCEEPAVCSRLALTTLDIDFDRSYDNKYE